MKYRPKLDDLILHAQPREKIGCIGRTGAEPIFRTRSKPGVLTSSLSCINCLC